jgi:hypothetical protein
VPHLSESLLIGIERRQFVESDVNKFARIIDAPFALISNAFPRADARGQLRRACTAPSYCAPRHQIDAAVTGALQLINLAASDTTGFVGMSLGVLEVFGKRL